MTKSRAKIKKCIPLSSSNSFFISKTILYGLIFLASKVQVKFVQATWKADFKGMGNFCVDSLFHVLIRL